jgi:hypothetical protein
LTPTDVGGGVASVTYTWGGVTQTSSGSSPVEILVDQQGSHTLTYSSTDLAGNTEPQVEKTLKLDLTAPTLTDDAKPGWHSTGQTVTVQAWDEGGSGLADVTVSLDGVVQALPLTGGKVTIATEGKHLLTYSAADAAGNVAGPFEAETWIDSQAPSTNLTGVDNGAIYYEAVTLTLAAADPPRAAANTSSGVAAIQYSLDGGELERPHPQRRRSRHRSDHEYRLV